MKTIRPVSTPGAPTWGKLKAGDTVVVETPDGKRWRFIVHQIDGDTIVAPGGQRYSQNEIVRLQRRSFSAPKTAGMVAGIVGGTYLALLIAVVSALGSFW